MKTFKNNFHPAFSKMDEERVQCISEILALGATSAYFSRNLLYVCPAPFNFPVEAAAE